MSVSMIVKCNRTWGAEGKPCRAGFVVDGVHHQWSAREAAERAGWSRDGPADVCPSHTRMAG